MSESEQRKGRKHYEKLYNPTEVTRQKKRWLSVERFFSNNRWILWVALWGFFFIYLPFFHDSIEFLEPLRSR